MTATFWTKSAPIWRISILEKLNFTSVTMISGKNLLNSQQNYKQIETQKLKKKLNNCKSLSHVSQPTLQNQNKQLRVKKCLTRLNLKKLFHLVGSTHLSTLRQNEKLVTISWQLKIFLSRLMEKPSLTISALSYDLVTKPPLLDRTIFKQPLWSVHWWMILSMKELSSGELQLVDLIYQKTTAGILQVVKVFLIGFVNLQVKKKMTILSFVVS